MITIEIGDKEYKVEEAKTEEQRRKGLSDKKNLPENQGMLFYLDYPQSVDFWMKDTSIPLDIIFINSDKEVNQIYYSLNKEDIKKEYTKAYNEWGKAIRDKISVANKMLNDLIGGYNKFMEAYEEED